MSLNDHDYNDVQESKDFGAVKKVTTQLRVREVTIEKAPDGKTYGEFVQLLTEFVDPSSVESIDPTDQASAPIVKLYFHTPGARGMAKRALEAHGIDWNEYVGAADKEAFLIERLAGQEATAKITVQTHRKDTGEELENPRNQVSYVAQQIA